MKYFFISLDKLYTDAPAIENWSDIIDIRNIEMEKSHILSDRISLPIRSNLHTTFTDIISFPFLLVTEEFQKMIKLYEPLTPFKEVILLDGKNKLSELYYMPILERIDCLTADSVYNLDKSVIKRGVIDPAKTKDKAIFWLDGVNGTYTVVRLDLIESVLRRAGRGIALKELELKEED